jgi:hypothetical protein
VKMRRRNYWLSPDGFCMIKGIIFR